MTMRTLLLLLVAAIHCAPASAQSLRVLTAGAFKQVVVNFVPAFEAAHGLKVEVQNDTAGALLKRIAAGEAFDVVFLTPAGLADLAIHQVSEILPVSGVVLVGLLPEEIQNYTTYGYGIAADTRLQDLARKFVGALSTREAAEVIRTKGMQPVQ